MKNNDFLNYDSPRIEKSEVYLEHVIADSGNGQKLENPGQTESMKDASDYGGGFGSDPTGYTAP